jgi:hypothetical protein
MGGRAEAAATTATPKEKQMSRRLRTRLTKHFETGLKKGLAAA